MTPTIHSPNAEFQGRVAGVDFVDGVGDSDSESALAYFARHGYAIGDQAPAEAAAPVAVPAEGEEVIVPDDTWTLPDLRAFAAEHDIPISGTRKDEIFATILAAIGDQAPAE